MVWDIFVSYNLWQNYWYALDRAKKPRVKYSSVINIPQGNWYKIIDTHNMDDKLKLTTILTPKVDSLFVWTLHCALGTKRSIRFLNIIRKQKINVIIMLTLKILRSKFQLTKGFWINFLLYHPSIEQVFLVHAMSSSIPFVIWGNSMFPSYSTRSRKSSKITTQYFLWFTTSCFHFQTYCRINISMLCSDMYIYIEIISWTRWCKCVISVQCHLFLAQNL